MSKEEAKNYLRSAEHILYRTYPLVKEPRLLLKVMDDIFLAIAETLAALLEHEKAHNRINSFENNFDAKVNIFRRKCLIHYNLDPDYVKFILEVKEIILQHRKSPVEFVRDNKFVICSDEYKMKSMSSTDVSNYLQKAKAFYGRIDNILVKGGI